MEGIVFILLLLLHSTIEQFQYFKSNNSFIAYDYIPVKSKNIMFSIPIKDKDQCNNLCKTTPRCVGYNYNQNSCTLYRGDERDFVVKKVYRKYW